MLERWLVTSNGLGECLHKVVPHEVLENIPCWACILVAHTVSLKLFNEIFDHACLCICQALTHVRDLQACRGQVGSVVACSEEMQVRTISTYLELAFWGTTPNKFTSDIVK